MKRTLAAALLLLSLTTQTSHATEPHEIRLGFSSINPETRIAKDKGWIEDALKSHGVTVKWVESLGSNKSLEFLRGKNIDIASTSSASAFLARANGTPIKFVYWTGRNSHGAPILVRHDSPYKSITDLRGKKIAATPGTGPLISLIAALHKHGLTEKDVEIVSLQHAQGRLALAAGRVEAWAALEPDWTIAEVQNKARILFVDKSLAGGGGLNVREEYLKANPEIVKIVLAQFNRARVYSNQNPEQAIKDFAESSKVDLDVARKVFQRSLEQNDNPEIVPQDAIDLAFWGELYKKLGSVPADTNVAAVVKDVLDPTVFKLSK
ncbi:aliphatic sulfonate ABC transporter substrate-binding protein [Uliginosibacterium aquaticum]|uniref:Aliphatic sulfonate ABC transporter substrate-binding protein n=1 Tax=Uliginosibacterium aquaticum TaxID=2731212 RepID=A0ABX2IJ84_9RHOO|nr:aliphatic sulfonate ABC transporter substrate-binding protein [Uliginosibacterium aquaticum]NSL55062.1 aliphatic sulfonate ABC transporter substrate-binding protein [Uliginosibacterium aquaticum]